MNNSQYLKQAIRDHVDGIELSDQQFDRLSNLQNRKKQTARRRYLHWSLAASVLITVLIFSLNYVTNTAILPKIATEIAENHARLDKVEYQSSQFELVSRYFDKLDFTPKLPGKLPGIESGNLVGARYCSVHGNIALQLRFGKGIVDSSALYIALPNANSRHKIKQQLSQHNNEFVTTIDDIEIRIWFEQGLLYAVSRQH